MKKVRFESTHNKQHLNKMNDSECHSPRPFIERGLESSPPVLVTTYPRVLTYSNDPVQRYERSNSSPYPVFHKTHLPCLPEKEPSWKPSDELNLSLLDASIHEPRQPVFSKSILKDSVQNKTDGNPVQDFIFERNHKPFLPVENNIEPHNVLIKDNSFFIKRDSLKKYTMNVNPIHTQLNRLSLGKENYVRKNGNMVDNIEHSPSNNPMNLKSSITTNPTMSDDCRCHHCIKKVDCLQIHHPHVVKERPTNHCHEKEYFNHNCICSTPKNQICSHCHHVTPPLEQNMCKTCNCQKPEPESSVPQNAVDRKTWAIKKYEQNKESNNMEVEKQTNVSKEKREPTVADLFKIIKLQNEQLQLLQDKVDKFMTSRQNVPTITCSTEHVALNAVDNNIGKMSVGVMTSFEMIRTSTVINKEVVKQSNEAQIQCNQSQISIKEVVTKPVNMNFLDGIIPKNVELTKIQTEQRKVDKNLDGFEEKTLNELSLCNVQVDNATTPLMSPEQTLYLDLRDYSDSEASNNDQSNGGWTYYNKVMTHVNGMLQDSEMPSSASAMYRNMKQQCVQMHIDTTNVSVTKRVKFGDDPLGLHQPHIYANPATDTSLKMNQLAAKYLKTAPPVPRPAPLATTAPIDMSFATRNYMEKHKLLHGLPAPKSAQAGEMPRFLDITALKQQPKFL